MSGRKSSEVAGVLAQGEKVRQMTDGLYTNQIEEDIKNALKSIENAKGKKQQAQNSEASLAPEADKMFGEKGKEQVNKFNALKQKFNDMQFDEGEIQNIRQELKDLDNALKAADKEAEDIRTAIKGKRNGWYCDAEYKRANDLVVEYGKLRDKRVKLSHRAANIRQTSAETQTVAIRDAENLQNLKTSIDNMNETAKKRQESNAMRETLNKQIAAIPSKEANKFFGEEFNNIKREIDEAVKLQDEALISEFRDKFNKVSEFSAKLKERINLWKQQKADAESLMRTVCERADFELIGPVEYFNKKERGAKTPLFDYLKQYEGHDYSGDYNNFLNDGKKMIRNESFVEAVAELKKALNFVNELRDKAAALQEVMLKKTELAGAIQKVMHDMKYNVKTRFIDDNPNNGYHITCDVGEEIIDFDTIDIDDDGNIIVSIDHTEAMGGNCQNSWPEIAKRMQDAGIPVTNVTSHGKSVLRDHGHSPSDRETIDGGRKHSH